MEVFLLWTIGSAADLAKIGIETLKGRSISEISLGVFMRGAVIAYSCQILKRVGLGDR